MQPTEIFFKFAQKINTHLVATRVVTLFFLTSSGFTFSTWAEDPPALKRGKVTLGDDLQAPWTHAQTELWVGTGATLLTLILEDQVVDPAQAETVEDRPLGRLSNFADQMGKLIPNAAYALGYGLHGALGGNSRLTDKSLTMIKASLYSAGVTTALKYLVREPRPDGSSRNSFPSGHATTIGAFAGVVIAQESLGWGVLASGLAGMVALGRMNDNRHYLHDVLAGLTIGAATGLGMARLHIENNSDLSFRVVPGTQDRPSLSAQVSWQLPH